MKQKCVGCKDECEMDSPMMMRGCTYEDGVYPKDAQIWYLTSVIDTPEKGAKAQRIIQRMYPDAWEQEEHNEPRP